MPHKQSRSLTQGLEKRAVSVRLSAIGDPDQAIYGFRGADVQSFHRFDEDFPGTKRIVLTKNYRSTQKILNGSAALMEGKGGLEGTKGPGDSIRIASCHTQAEEAEMAVEHIEKLVGGTTYFSLDSGRVASHEDGGDLGFGDIAILFRLNAQGDSFEAALSRAGIPYIRSGERPLISRYPVDIVWYFLHALQNPSMAYYLETYLDLTGSDSQELNALLDQCDVNGSVPDLIEKAVNLHGFDDLSENAAEALTRLKRVAQDLDKGLSSFLDTLSLDRGIDHGTLAGDRVALMSLHAAKGLEWPVVFIAGCEEGLIPCSLFGDQDDAEERRLLYVGMTRAERILILSHAGQRTLNGRPLQLAPSTFLNLISEELCEPLERSSWKRKKKSHQQLDLF